MPDSRDLEPRCGSRSAPLAAVDRHPGFGKAELGRLFEASFGVPYRTDIARESDFAEYDSVSWDRRLGQRRDEGGRHGEICRRLNDPQPAGDVQIDVIG